MYTSFRAINFRGFEDLQLDDLKRVNLIAGKNNVGKTSLLEAIMIHVGQFHPEAFGFIQISRQMFFPFEMLFLNFGDQLPIKLLGTGSQIASREVWLNTVQSDSELAGAYQRLIGNLEQVDQQSELAALKISQQNNPDRYLLKFRTKNGTSLHLSQSASDKYLAKVSYLPASYRHPSVVLSEWYSQLALDRQENPIIEALRIIEPRLKDVRVLLMDGAAFIYADIGLKQPIPLSMMGEGMNRLAALVLAIGNAAGGYMLVDEVENGIHYSVLTDMWRAIATAARLFDVQVFATTHSRECIVAAHEAFKDSDPYDFRLLRLDRSKEGKIRAVSYDEETLEAAIEMNLEVR